MELLRMGSRGPAAALLQTALRHAGFSPGAADGIYGPQTRDAVVRFQRSRGLAADGIAGPITVSALQPWYLGSTRHTVRAGDTFWRLANSYQTTVQAIRTANPHADPNRLSIGQVLTIPYRFPVVATDIPISGETVSVYLRGLVLRYPFLRTGIIGTSQLGAPIRSLTIGNGSAQVFYNGAHHANEWITGLLLLHLCELYCDAVARGAMFAGQNAAALFSRTNLCVVPVVNPDGVDLVTGALTGGDAFDRARAIAADYPAIPFPQGWKANLVGVDPNLSYPAGWDRAREIKFAQGYRTPAPRDFVGASPLQAVESRAVYELTRQNDFALTVSFHAQGEVIYWQYQGEAPAGAEAIGRAFAAASGYSLEPTPYASSFAGYKDWFLQDYGRPGFTVEVGQGANPLPLAQLPAIRDRCAGIFALGLALAQ